ncbi:MAG: S8 family serine peptidase [Chloroflexales bacterium]|nr:S8 family serine peptidase [Chloroflexales bacterium]
MNNLEATNVDPALWELTEGVADEEIRAIIRLHDGEAVPEHVRIIARFGNIATVRMQRGQIIEVHSAANVASLKARRFVVPDVEIINADEEPASVELFTSRRPHEATETGQGVIVGCADWGVDFAHPDFRHANGSTRLLALWDQAAPFDPKHDNRYGYGTIHTAAEINQALATTDPYAALNYYPYRSDLGGAGAHGAHVLSIAAGSRYGVAPDADLVFVHMSSDQETGGLANLGDSVTVLEAVDFIFRTADTYGKPCVCNLSMGRHGGPHDGNTLVERGFDAALTERAGRAIVQSTGNYFDLAIHASGQIRPGESKRLSFEIDEADRTPNELEVWYPGSDRLVVELIQPDGTRARRVLLDDSIAVHADSQEVGKLYHRARDPNNFDNHINLFLYPGAPDGTWQLVLVAEDVVDGRYNAWIERDAICLGCQVRFDPRDADTNSTTGTICNGFRTIAVGAYNPHTPDRQLASFSSSGPTRDGRGKPDLVAPGYRIRAARSAPRDLPDNAPLSTLKSGTSMAAPHVTGTVALMFEAAARPLRIQETRNLLIGTTDPAPADLRDSDQYRFGSGYLNSDAAIAATRAYTAASTDNERSAAIFQRTPQEAAVNIEHNGNPAMTHDDTLFFDDAEDLDDDQFDRLEAYADSRDDWIDDDSEDDSAYESGNAFGQLRVEAAQYPVVALSATPDYTTNSLDDALQFALNQRDSHTLITGDIYTGTQFAVYRWHSTPLPSAPSVVEFDAAATVAMLILNGTDAYLPSNPLTRTLRWVKLNRPHEFYSLAERDRRRQRRRWIQRIYAARDAIAIPNVTVDRAWLNDLSMPALRLLLAQFAAAIFRVRNIDQNNDRGRFHGGAIRGVTLPVLRAPLSEPDCYLPVISGREGRMESINAYDEGAGVSLGPIQFTVINAYLFRFLWNVWRDDMELFNQAFGALNWTMRQHGDHPDLLVNAGAANAIVLHGRRNDRERNVGYFQSGTPGVTDFDQIDAAFRRDLTARFRTLVVWPHIQEKIIETSAEYLAPGLRIIHRPEYGIPALNPANPDRDAFILKALLLSAYVRYNACLRPLLAALQSWTTPAEKLRNWRNALNVQQNWGVCNRRRRDRLLQRLGAQEREAEQVYEMLLRAMGRSSTDEQEGDTIWQDDPEAMDDILEYDDEDIDLIDTQLETSDTTALIEQTMGHAGDRWLSAATLFDAFAGASRAAERRAFAEQFSLVARPGAPLSVPLHAGDLVVRRALGEGMVGHIALIAEPTLRTAAEATAAGLTPESMRAGRYIQVVEGGIRSHSHADGYARRLLDADGRLPHDTLVLCPHTLGESATPRNDAVGSTALSANSIVFPSGEALRIVTGFPEGKDEEYWDPTNSGNPLLDTGSGHKDKYLSKNFTVRELTTSGGISADLARIDPKLVECLQRLRDYVGKAVTITSGYRSWKRNKAVYAGRKNPDGTPKKPTLSQHCAGRAADIKIAGMNGLEIGKAVIEAYGPNVGIGLGNTFAHVDVRGAAAAWSYGGVNTSWVSEIKRYQRERARLASLTPPVLPASAPASIPALNGPQVPNGFRQVMRRGVARGLTRYGGERVDRKLPELVRMGRVLVSNEDIDTFQRIANVETSGLVQGINTWDSAVVSIGFMQWTLQHGKLQEWIGRAEPAFRRYGIELAPAQPYVWTKNGRVTSQETAIRGASNKDDLRWDGWAERFFLAGLDDEIIVAEVRLAQEHLRRHLNGLRRYLNNPALFQTFMQHYQASLQIRGIFQAAYNNLPAAARRGAAEALRSAGTVTTARFLEIFQQAILQAYIARNDDGSRIISATATGASFT